MDMTFRSLTEEKPGAAWQKIFATGWPGWKRWLRARQAPYAPTLAKSEAALNRHMPEMVPVWRSLVERVGADEEAARFLTFWSPPRYLGQCAQAVSGGEAPTLVRNYDLDPRLSEATMLKSNWTGRPVIGMVEGLAGLADGINADGLAVSLAYGGRRVVGEGFGVPMVVRYLLETCGTVEEASDALRRLPHHMSYNLTLLDRQGAHVTAMIAPDREIVLTDRRYITNHQRAVEDERHGAFCNTMGRLDHLRDLDVQTLDGAALTAAFQADPLYNTQFEAGFGTVYTAAYEPTSGAARLIWPGQAPWVQSFDDFREEERRVVFAAGPVSEEDEPEWLRYVPQDVRRFVMLGIENAA